MKLLFDENLSPVLPAALADCYVESQHVRDVGLKTSPDIVVWTYAARNELVIVTKDSDFRQRSFVHGPSSESHLDRTGQLLDEGG